MDKIYVKNKHLFKNKIQMVLYLIIFCVIIYLFIYLGAKDYKKDIPSNERFASNFSMVSTDNVFKYVNASDARMVAKGKKGIVLFGTKNEWVNYYAYIVNKVAKEVGIDDHPSGNFACAGHHAGRAGAQRRRHGADCRKDCLLTESYRKAAGQR